MRFQDLLLLAVVPAFLLVSCANEEGTCTNPDHDHAAHEGHDHAAADDYHATGNCAMEFTAADSARREAKYAEPGVKMVELSNGYRVFTQTVGENPDVKILTLHGGPACTHEYMKAISNVLPEGQGYEVILYDQLGSFYSDQPTEDIWTIDRWCEEVEEVRQALGLDASNFYLLGNSWGGILGMEYALRYQDNLNGLIVCNMVTSIPEYAAYNEEVLRPQMDPEVLAKLLPTRRRATSRTRISCSWSRITFTPSTSAAWKSGRRTSRVPSSGSITSCTT